MKEKSIRGASMKKMIGILVCTLVIASIAVVPTSIATFTEEKPRIIQQLVNNGVLSELWIETDKLTSPDEASYGGFGESVSIDGDYVVVGAHDDDVNTNDSGAAYIFKRDVSSLTEEVKLVSSDGALGDRFGDSVSIDGDYVVVGAPIASNDIGRGSGSAYIFKRGDGNSWTEEAKLTASDGASHEFFGRSVSIDGDYVVVGAHSNKTKAGSAYIFKRGDGDSWTEEAKLTASDGAPSDWFGNSVSIDGDYVVVGAAFHDEFIGAAYIFKRDGSSWTEEAKLTVPKGQWYDCFGNSVSIGGDYAVVGAENTNRAYVFKRDGSSWTEEAALRASDKTSHFGCSVSIDGEHIIIGAIFDDDNGRQSGSAYIFKRDGISWTEVAKLLASDGEPKDWFGWSVSIDGDYAIVGAPNADSYRGSIYVFTKYPAHFPNKPDIPSGQINVKINIKYTYTASTTDPDDDEIFYLFDWGDGTNSDWIGSYPSGETAEASHIWTSKEDYYEIKVKAKDTNGEESPWSDPLIVTMPRNRVINRPLLKFLQQYPMLSQLFQRFLRL